MRITAALFSAAALMSVIATADIAAAQDQPTQDQAPAGAQNFGPRARQPVGAGAPAEAAPPSQKIATIGAWEVQCGDVPAAGNEPARKQCGMVQVVRNEKNKNIGLSVIVIRGKGPDNKTVTMMRVMAPIGVYLPTGVALEIDGAAVGRVPFTRCRPQICEAIAEGSAPTLEKMRKGKSANFIIYEGPGAGIPMQVSLSGFAAALTELDKQ